METNDIKDALGAYHKQAADGLKSLKTKLDAIELKQREQSEELLHLYQTASSLPSPKERKQYSLLKVVHRLADPKSKADCGREMEMHDELASKMFAPPNSILVPHWALGIERKDVTYGGTGSNLVPEQYMGSDLIDVLRARSIVVGLGATVLNGLSGDVLIPKKTGGHTGYWLAGDGADSITESTPAFSQVSLKPSFVGGLSDWSYKMLIQGSPSVEMLAREDLIATLSTAMDAAAIAGTGADAQPRGVLNVVGIGSTTYANGGAPSFANVVGLETTVRNSNVVGPLAYATTPTIAGGLKTTDVGTDTGQFVLQGGRMNGLPTEVSNNVPAGYIVCGHWADLLVGIWGEGIAISVDQSTHFASGSVRVRAMLGCDIQVRHASSFAEIHEAAA